MTESGEPLSSGAKDFMIKRHISENPLSILLVAIPLAVIAKLVGWGSAWVFIFSAVGVIPLAGYIGEATEILAVHAGPRVGGLLNATLGNAAELIITLFAVQAGLLDLVKASITGSILGNLLLVLGFSILAGGLKNGIQTFDKRQLGNHAVLLTMAVLALAVPSLFNQSVDSVGNSRTEYLSLGVALIMIVLYAIGLLYSLKFSNSSITYQVPERLEAEGKWPTWVALLVLAISTLGVIGLSELLVGAVEEVVVTLGLSEFFLGIILIPIVGNVAEHVVAVRVALKNKMELSVEIAVSSSLQIALFVAPVLVFLSLLMGHPLTLIFNPFELIALGAAVLVSILVASDGESNWLEGATLLGVYLILGLAFFFLPT
jgi:Ca2+:H+ antiporter